MIDLAAATKRVEKRLLLMTCSSMYKLWLTSMATIKLVRIIAGCDGCAIRFVPRVQSQLWQVVDGSLLAVMDVPSDLFQEYKASFGRWLIVWISLLL
jgi:hypothetical protein